MNVRWTERASKDAIAIRFCGVVLGTSGADLVDLPFFDQELKGAPLRGDARLLSVIPIGIEAG